MTIGGRLLSSFAAAETRIERTRSHAARRPRPASRWRRRTRRMNRVKERRAHRNEPMARAIEHIENIVKDDSPLRRRGACCFVDPA